ncbi:APG9-domain-containing protein [Piedraia hortae CBS 480.64]|uniref:Autophagy-related protein 9 n=1 Tax=Piedraia hortae CBS 480.64 TaxID=1314780 RepID=A0A6A7C7F9_9PEZI|nr:APG9-domain-containing protein [Piedraia hortae CBS 480.64]
MMSSRVLSRLLPTAEDNFSIHVDQEQTDVHVEPYHDDDHVPEDLLYDADAQDNADRRLESGDWRDNEDVPESFLLETNPTTRKDATSQWRRAQQQYSMHQISPRRHASPEENARANAMWTFTNVSNLDAFLREVYHYYVNHGIWSIFLKRTITLLTEAFVFSFAMFLSTCIDYSKIPAGKKMEDVLIPKCMAKASWIKNAAVFIFIVYWCLKLVSSFKDCRRLYHMHNFFQHVLGINDEDIQTATWVEVVDGLVKIKDANIATAKPGSARKYTRYAKSQQRLDAESIANRLMRQENYCIAMYNKDILDMALPLPFVGSRQFFSKSLEWCINLCLTNFIFDEQGNIRAFCLDHKNRHKLVQTLKTRLRFAALMSVIIAPFNILCFCILFFLKYYTEFTRNPSKVGARAFTPFAEWKIRQFNELDHLFQRRLRMAMPFADDYLKQFPKNKTDQMARFIAFISGSFAAVLALATLFDPELFLTFEITPGKTAIFYLSLTLGTFTVAYSMATEETEVHDPVLHLNNVLLYTNYKPRHWKGRMHSSEVRAEFSSMYQVRVIIFLEELLSLIVAPWILLRTAETRCERIIDFFRENSVHVDGIGYQCNFAVFNFKKDVNAEDPTSVLQERQQHSAPQDDKMASSMQNFARYYERRGGRGRRPHEWQPQPTWPSLLEEPLRRTRAAEPRSGRGNGKATAVSQSVMTEEREDSGSEEKEEEDVLGRAGVLGMLYQAGKVKGASVL